MIRPKYDMLWKGILEEVINDLLVFVDPDIGNEIDLERGVQFLDKELADLYPEPDKASRTRVVDKLVKLYLRDGSERWMLLHLEVQGKNGKDFPRRMFDYYARLFIKHHQPIAAIAVLTGEDGNKRSGLFETSCLWTRASYEYKTISIVDYSEEELLASTNPFAAVMMVARQVFLTAGTLEERDELLFEQKILIAKMLKERMSIFGKKKTGVILSFLNNYVVFNSPEINRKFMARTEEIFEKRNPMGYIEQLAEFKSEGYIQEAKREGAKEQQEKAVRSLLANTEFSAKKIAELIDVPVSFVRKLKADLNTK